MESPSQWKTILLLILVILLSHASTALSTGFKKVCPSGTLQKADSGVCASINDVRHLFTKDRSSPLIYIIPSLADLRSEKAREQELTIEEIPPPGGIGVGTIYNEGSLQALEKADLRTTMYIHPDGINPSGKVEWLYATATNRTEKTVEVVGIYSDYIGDQGELGIFDWSCSPSYPCPDGNPNPSWQWTRPFSEFTCNMAEIVSKANHLHTVMHYANVSVKSNPSPDLWTNSVYLWNFCNEEWDLVYEHEFRYNQHDCSSDNSCGWWGPILETFAVQQPKINELGFEDTLLFHDGIWSYLSPNETDFVDPVDPWRLFYLEPNRGFSAGNSYIIAPWETAYANLFDMIFDLELMRQYRDEFLSKTAKGKLFTYWLYKNSDKALEVLFNNPELMIKANSLITANRDAVFDVLDGSEAIIDNPDEIVAFLDAYAKKAPPVLKVLATLVKWDMLGKKRRGKLFFGFRLK